MQMIEQPLALTREQNERMLRESEQASAERVARLGDTNGNRHERRLAARAARRERAL